MPRRYEKYVECEDVDGCGFKSLTVGPLMWKPSMKVLAFGLLDYVEEVINGGNATMGRRATPRARKSTA